MTLTSEEMIALHEAVADATLQLRELGAGTVSVVYTAQLPDGKYDMYYSRRGSPFESSEMARRLKIMESENPSDDESVLAASLKPYFYAWKTDDDDADE